MPTKTSVSHVTTVEAITNLLFVEDRPQQADLAFVFGSNWLPTMDIAIDLFKNGLVPKILVSGASYAGAARDKTECEVFCDHAIAHGVPPEVLLREERATNTLQNIQNSAPLIAERIGWDRVHTVAFICKTFHARRVLMTAARHWPAHLRYLCLPVVDDRGIQRDNWFADPVGKQRVLEEVRRIADYTLKGDIGEF